MSADTTQCCEASAPTRLETPQNTWVWHLGIVALIAAWFAIYQQLPAVSEWLTGLLPVARQSEPGAALAFFLYDTPKVIMLLALIVFVMGVVRSFFSPAKTRALLAGKSEGVGNVLAASLGILTPFCSCSAVPLFVGFVSAGIPLGVTFSFLIAAPMVNEVAVILLWGLVGPSVATIYLFFGLAIAILSGWAIGALHLEGWLQPWVRKIHAGSGATASNETLTMIDRYREGAAAVREVVGKVWLWVIAGISLGALIHGYVPEEAILRIMGASSWWSVPAAVIAGIPMYSGASGMIPIVEALLSKGAALGTVLAFMMSVIALSLPEMLILRKVLSLRLIAVFVAVVGSGILAVGFLFNAIF